MDSMDASQFSDTPDSSRHAFAVLNEYVAGRATIEEAVIALRPIMRCSPEPLDGGGFAMPVPVLAMDPAVEDPQIRARLDALLVALGE